MSKYNRKKENPATTAASADEFVGFWQKLFEKARPFARGIGWTIVGFVVVVAAVGGATSYFESRAERATEAWGRVVRVYDADLLGEDSAKDPESKADARDAKEKPDSVPRFKTAKERAEATLAELDKLPAAAAKNSRLFRAGVLYDLERYEEARAAYAQAASDGLATELTAVAHQGVALCLEQLGKVDEAITAYGQIAPKDDKATEFMRDQALFGQARLYEKKGDKAKAIESYKELTTKFPTSSVREDAQNRLVVLETT